ncbi:MAG TPA: hypothetical protein ENH82_10950 [bacterium]|nr:hypothetical protein [bacterium]
MKCPECKKEFDVNLKYSIPKESRVSMALTVKKGCMFEAEVIGEQIANLAKLINSVADNVKVKTQVFVEKISMKDGELIIDYLIATKNEE